MSEKSINRREFLRLVGLGAGSMLLAACAPDAPRAVSTLPPALGTVPASGEPLTVELTAAAGTVSLLPGTETRVWQYRGKVTGGDTASLQAIPDSYLGPVLRLERGQEVKVRFNNDIPDASIIHWHGLNVPEAADGHPRLVVQEGGSYDYVFKVLNRAGTYWYHPHPHMRTGPQAYYGLAGLMIISDPEEAKLGLPSGEFDLPLVIQDRSFDNDNQLVYAPDTMNGFFGDQVFVNGQSQRTWQVQARPYRLRLLNGSNARIYKLAWNDGTPLTIIATDGGLLEKPIQRDYITLAPAERVELWVDFSVYSAGQELLLKSLPFSAPVSMMGSGGLPNGSALDILRLHVVASAGGSIAALPQTLSQPGFYTEQDAVNRANPRSFTLAMMMMTGTLNGRTFAMEEVADDETVRLGDLEVWEFYNTGSGGMGMMSSGHPHPLHVHNVQFQVLSRQVDQANQTAYEQVSVGFVDEGWKDTVLVWPGERVRVLVRFENYAGLYLYHCHNLEHEDGGMMRNYRII